MTGKAFGTIGKGAQVRSGVDVAGITSVSYDKNSKDFNDVTMNAEKKDLKISGDLVNVEMNDKKTSAGVASIGFSYDKEWKDLGGKVIKDNNDVKVTGDLIIN